ncbi:MAG: peptide MFS transporter [Paludibacter sp.]|nr:peptide MFS transporter [Bacteroidales bacterium]MCM1069737.1 peptide MFS transporter [Prevotella sp.]MCM1354422.1 peptide MFS transporter [Bacteroides sp.]MCM1443240.1 peptide MFS transporter [Muribaculum sp.]MCM1482456.1 peptide MFS transporter [Paludibacter sp.]
MFKSHPKGLIPAALANMGERFGYYIMNAVLLLFLCSKFGLSDSTAGIIYSVFYAGIYVLSLLGGIIADRTQNYNRTIQWGLIIMALGYVALSIPLFSEAGNTAQWTGILVFTCFALLLIAFGNGLFKGNLQAIVGKMYDDMEAQAAVQGEEELRIARSKRDAGFQIFYVFINIGGLIAPFVAPLLRSWWLKVNHFVYNADMPELCHRFLNDGEASVKFTETLQKVVLEGYQMTDYAAFCTDYLHVFNTGIHYSFIASVVAMLISLLIFLCTKKMFPQPAKKESSQTITYTAEEKVAMAQEIKQRMYALFAVLGIAIFFWFSFHQNGQSLSLFARDFVKTDSIAPEIWQALNPFFVIVLTPIIMAVFGALSRRGKEISTPRKIAIGMAIAGVAYLFLTVFSAIAGYPSGALFRGLTDEQMAADGLSKAGPWVLIVTYFFLTVAELFISPLGLSFVSKVAPKNLLGLCQGLWLGATALGNLLIWLGPVMYNAWDIKYCWAVFFGVCMISMGVMLGMVKWLEKVAK